MSGAEAVVGLVAAGAGLMSLAVQLGESAIKLKRLYNMAKNAPATIQNLVDDLETMRLVLIQLERHRQHDSHRDFLLLHCIRSCQQRTGEIQILVDKMERHMTRGVWRGKMYTAFSEREAKESLADLERAKSLLEFAYMMYLTTEQSQREQMRDRTLAQYGTVLSGLQAQASVHNAGLSQLTLVLQSSKLQPPQPSRTGIVGDSLSAAHEPASADVVNVDDAGSKDFAKSIHHRERPHAFRRVRR